MVDVKTKIEQRAYQSPGRARAAVAAANLSPREQKQLLGLITAWENEEPLETVIAGTPEALEAELVDAAVGRDSEVAPPAKSANGASEMHITVLSAHSVSLNARVRVRLTAAGVAALHAARKKVLVPDDLVERRGVWETELWTLMVAFGDALFVGGEPLTVNHEIEFLRSGALS